ncbi:MAG: NAD-binding protein [Actinomycetota bacterium]
MYVIVAGCGRVGSQLAQALSYEAHDVVVIDKDAGAFRRLGGTFNGITLEGVAFDEELLLEAGIDQADAFAAVTNHDNTNLMAAEVATTVFEVPRVISRLYYPEKELTFFKMGIDYVCSTTLLAERAREKLYQGADVKIQQDRLDLGIQVVDMEVPEGVEGATAGSLNYGVSSRLVTLLRGNREIYWNAGTPLTAGDGIVMSLRREGWATVAAVMGSGPAAHIDPAFSGPTPGAAELFTPGRAVIGGCSAVGAQLALLLSMDGHEVTLIDTDPSRFGRLPSAFEGTLIEGTIFNEDALTAAGIESADYFLAMTKKDNANLMAAEVARHLFGVPRVVARLFNTDKERTYQALRMDYVCGTRLLAQTLQERILLPLVRTRGAVLNNRLDLVEFECPRRWEGMTVRKAWEGSGVALAFITRRTTGYLPENNLVLRQGDTITAVATEKNVRKLEKHLHR